MGRIISCSTALVLCFLFFRLMLLLLATFASELIYFIAPWNTPPVVPVNRAHADWELLLLLENIKVDCTCSQVAKHTLLHIRLGGR